MRKTRFTVIAAGSEVGPLHITAAKQGDTAVISLSGYIGDWAEINERGVMAQIKGFKDKGVKKAQLHLNTQGGSVFAATQIANVISDNFDEVQITVGALCASAGSYLTSKFKSFGRPNSQFMIHRPKGSFSGDVEKIKTEIKSLENLTKDYLATYAAKTGLSEEKIEEMWAKGDYWMNAKEALALGFIDGIVAEKAEISADDVQMLVACAAPEIPTPTIQTQTQTTDMDTKLIAAKLGLPSDATEAQITAKLEELNKAAQTASDLQAKLDADQKTSKDKEIKAMLDQAEKDKKITATARPNFEALASQEGGLDNVKSIIEGLQPVAKAEVKPEAKGDAAAADHKDWSYADYQEKDPQAFLKLQEESPEKAESLIEAHYKE